MDDNLVSSMTWVVSLLLLIYESHAPDPALGVAVHSGGSRPGLDGPALTLVNGSSSLLVSLFTPGGPNTGESVILSASMFGVRATSLFLPLCQSLYVTSACSLSGQVYHHRPQTPSLRLRNHPDCCRLP